MLNFNNLTRQELSDNGLAFETAEEASLFASIILKELQVRIGRAIADYVGRKGTEEFEKCNTDAEAAAWLEQNCPDHHEIVKAKQDELDREILKYRDRIPGIVGNVSSKFRDMTIEEMDLSIRSYNCLNHAGIHTVADLIEFGDLSKIRNLGRKSEEEVKKRLWELTTPKPLPENIDCNDPDDNLEMEDDIDPDALQFFDIDDEDLLCDDFMECDSDNFNGAGAVSAAQH